MMPKQMCAIILTVLMSLLLVCGCDLGSGNEDQGKATDPDPAQVLKARASEYWQHKIKRNLEKAYQYESPERVKGLSLTDYIGTYGAAVQWLGAEVEKVTVQKKTGLVLMKIRYLWSFAGNPSRKDMPDEGLTSKLVDRWELVDGTWYHQFKSPKYAKPAAQKKKSSDGPVKGGATDPKKKGDLKTLEKAADVKIGERTAGPEIEEKAAAEGPETGGSPEPRKEKAPAPGLKTAPKSGS